jgi:arylsulfatase
VLGARTEPAGPARAVSMSTRHRTTPARGLAKIVIGVVGVVALFTTGAGCASGDADPPRWIHLARGHRAAGAPASVSAWRVAAPDGTPMHVLAEEDGGARVETLVPASAWRAGSRDGTWEVLRPPPIGFDGGDASGSEGARGLEVWFGEEPLARVAIPASGRAESVPLAPGSYIEITDLRTSQRIVVRPPAGAAAEAPPAGVRLVRRISRGGEVDGAWRTSVGGYAGEGLPVWPGERVARTCDVPARSVLRFCAVAGALRGAAVADDGEVEFEVWIDGELAARHAQPVRPIAVGEWREVALPPEGRAGAELAFVVRGDPALTAVLDPVIGPAAPAPRASAERRRARPDIVLFLADTFRADNLAAYGGEPGVTPALDALARRSVLFQRAWSPASWTLPAQASLMTGVFPLQHAATTLSLAISDELVTLAEQLARHGYRTGAVTDSAVVSRAYGFDQGFEWFCESQVWNLERTLASADAFLDADDGRPVFLFVHTYRTHQPFRSGADEDESAWWELAGRIQATMRAEGVRAPEAMARPEHVAAMRALYLEGARALDAAFGGWLAGLERRGVLANGRLVVTSDHGEAFGEHGQFLHGGALWEEKIRIPLLVHGGGLAPRVEPRGATLVDLPATLVRLAGVPPAPGWGGVALLDVQLAERPVFAFGAEEGFAFGVDPAREQIALIEGAHKVLAPAERARLSRGEFLHAFDMVRDPAEEHEACAPGEGWGAELCRRLAPEVERLSTALVEPAESRAGEDQTRALGALGYVEPARDEAPRDSRE